MTDRFRGVRAVLAAACLTACSAEQVQYRPVTLGTPGPERPALVLYLVGDGGDANPDRDAVIEHLRTNLEGVARDGTGPPVVVAFLGDNIYEEGAPVERLPEDEEKLLGQVLALPAAPNVDGVFVPGNHDWANGSSLEDGLATLARQAVWLEELSSGRDVRLLPDDGCPGPVTRDVADVHLVFLDTEWVLRDTDGRCGTAEAFYERLAVDLRVHADRRIVLLSHHPLATGGPHGGNVPPLSRGPFVWYLASLSGVSRQDLGSPAYTALRQGVTGAIARSGVRPLVHAAGHDHTLQVIGLDGPDEPRYQLVSGALARTENVRRIDGMRYGANGFGYIRLDFLQERVALSVYRRDLSGGPVETVFQCTIANEAPQEAASEECPEAPLAPEGA